jgi:IS1 family transposase
VNELSTAKRAQIIGAICEGMSIRATSRLTGASKNTITKLILDVGTAASIYQDRAFRNLDCKRVEADEIWAFVACKQANIPEDRQHEDDEIGSVWTWVALDAESKLVITFQVSQRTSDDAYDFFSDLAERISGRIQITTDAYHVSRKVVPVTVGPQVDYATIEKKFRGGNEDHKYSPGHCTGSKKRRVWGSPDMAKTSTSYVERQNLSIRMGSRRYTRLTNAFSKNFENHAAATALHFAYYNLCLVHGTVSKRKGAKTTPAMASGVEDHVWTVTELVELLDRYEG